MSTAAIHAFRRSGSDSARTSPREAVKDHAEPKVVIAVTACQVDRGEVLSGGG